MESVRSPEGEALLRRLNAAVNLEIFAEEITDEFEFVRSENIKRMKLVQDLAKDVTDLWEVVHTLQEQAAAARSHPERDPHVLRKQDPEA